MLYTSLNATTVVVYCQYTLSTLTTSWALFWLPSFGWLCFLFLAPKEGAFHGETLINNNLWRLYGHNNKQHHQSQHLRNWTWIFIWILIWFCNIAFIHCQYYNVVVTRIVFFVSFFSHKICIWTSETEIMIAAAL